jgi:translation elongation factor EF-1alpha
MGDESIGIVVHYYDRIEVAVINLTGGQLSLGDKIRIETRDGEFEQTVESMEINKEKVETVKPGDDFALKVDQSVREGDKVYKL